MHAYLVLRRWVFGVVLAALVWCAAPLALAQGSNGLATPAAPEITDVNQATEAQLDGLRGVGPATTRRILQARAQRPFTDWADLILRVRGIGQVSAAHFSAQGFVVNGAPYVPPGGTGAALPQER